MDEWQAESLLIERDEKNREVSHTIYLGMNSIILTAQNLRPEKTGIHARLSIALNATELAFTVCNIERSDERTRIVNEAYKFLGSTPEEASMTIDKGSLKFKLNQFCKEAWDAWLSVQSPVDVEGTDTSAVSYVLKPHVLTGGGTIMFGKPGRGKSFTAMMMALAVNYGTNHYWDTDKGKALFINLERPDRTIPPRINAVGKSLGLNSTSLAVYPGRSKRFVDIRDILERYILKEDIKFVVLDSISRTGAGDMKEDKVATATIDMLNLLGVSWVAIAHTPKYDDRIYYGSSQYEAGADVMLRHSAKIVDDEGSIVVLLEVTKANDMPIPRPMGLHYSFDNIGLSAIRTATKTETAPLVDDSNLYQSIKEYLMESGGNTASELSYIYDRDEKEVTSHLRSMFTANVLTSVGSKNNEKVYGVLV